MFIGLIDYNELCSLVWRIPTRPTGDFFRHHCSKVLYAITNICTNWAVDRFRLPTFLFLRLDQDEDDYRIYHPSPWTSCIFLCDRCDGWRRMAGESVLTGVTPYRIARASKAMRFFRRFWYLDLSLFLIVPSVRLRLLLLMFLLLLSWSRSLVGCFGHGLAMFADRLRCLPSTNRRYCFPALVFAQVTGLGPTCLLRVSVERLLPRPFRFFFSSSSSGSTVLLLFMLPQGVRHAFWSFK